MALPHFSVVVCTLSLQSVNIEIKIPGVSLYRTLCFICQLFSVHCIFLSVLRALDCSLEPSELESKAVWTGKNLSGIFII